ncbi:hypothetical protein ACL1BA_14085, partial [Corynebacterium striatum]
MFQIFPSTQTEQNLGHFKHPKTWSWFGAIARLCLASWEQNPHLIEPPDWRASVRFATAGRDG